MKGDFTRFTFAAAKHYDAVLMQQGRVQTDADWNEQVMIAAHRNRTEMADIIGPTGVPQDIALGGDGFLVTWEGGADGKEHLFINKGRYYADGVLVESEAKVQYDHQPGASLQPAAGAGIYLLYLDVWRRHITSLEDAGIREVALAGADSGTRSQLVFQVRAELVDKVDADINSLSTSKYEPVLRPADTRSTGTMGVKAGASPLENQLYRVEIHRGGTAKTASCKWSRDNGTVVAGIVSYTPPTPDAMRMVWQFSIVIDRNGRDSFSSFLPGQMVELHSDEFALMRKPGVFGTITQVVGDTLTLEVPQASAPLDKTDPTTNPLSGTTRSVRRWDNTWNPDDTANATLLNVGTDFTDDGTELGVSWLKLEREIFVNFAHAASDTYRTGDYWIVPARTISGIVDWTPRVRQDALGEEHLYAPLAFVRIQADGTVVKPATDIRDLRKVFPTLRSLGGGGGGIATGTGTLNYVPKWQKTGASVLINSSIVDDGTTCSISDQLKVGSAVEAVPITRFTAESINTMSAANLLATVPTTGGVKTYVEGVVNGTAGRISKFNAAHAISDSLLSEAGMTVTASGSLSVNSGNPATSTLNVLGAASMQDTLNVAGAATMQNTLKVGTSGTSVTISRFTSESIASMSAVTLASTVPTAQAVKDFMSYSVPPGTVMAWASETPPTGWIECNGWQYDGSPGTTYAALFNNIGKAFGRGSGAAFSFNVPDLRGKFVRGWDHGSGSDPEAWGRSAWNGGNAGDRVGSRQDDALRAHDHSFSATATVSSTTQDHKHQLDWNVGHSWSTWKDLDVNGGGTIIAIKEIIVDPNSHETNVASLAHTHIVRLLDKVTDKNSGRETRPVNLNLMYIIKY